MVRLLNHSIKGRKYMINCQCHEVNLQEKRLAQEIADIENDTGFKLRVLAQNYPETPGMLNLLDLLVVN